MSEEAPQGPHPAAEDEFRLLVAGFGGQGILTLGKLICMAAMRDGRNVTYLPSYGSEVRGGTAKCEVVLSSGLIYSPLVESADGLIILNKLSFREYARRLKPDGLLVVDSAAIGSAKAPDADVIAFPAGQMAIELGNLRVANVMIFGAFVAATGLLDEANCVQVLKELLGGRKAELLDMNIEAFSRGTELGASHARTA